MKFEAIVMTEIEVSAPDASGLRKYVYRVTIPASEFIYSVMAENEAQALMKARHKILQAMRDRPLTSRSEPMALSGQGGLGPAVAAAALGGLSLYTLVRWWRQRERRVVGYVDGRPVELTVTGVHGKPLEIHTAQAFARMREAAARDAIDLQVVSGFRTMEEQTSLYACYVNCNCNNCNYAAPPGYSNHQSGRALDLNTREPGVYAWLATHAGAYGFVETVAGEPWHWEFGPYTSG